MSAFSPPAKNAGAKVSFLGHAGLGVETDEFHLLCDPWFDARGANLGSWHQYPRNDHLDLSHLRKADWVAVTHEHLDHFDPWFLSQLPASTRLLIPKYPGASFRRRIGEAATGVVIELAPWEPFPLDNRGSWITAIPDVSPMWHDSAFLIVAEGCSILNCNDAKLTSAQTRRAKYMAGGTLSLMAIQASRAAWHPMAYDNYSHDQMRGIAYEKKLDKLRSVALLIRATKPEITVPFAGPPCFLDPDLDENNWVLERERSGAYADPEEARDWLAEQIPGQRFEVFRPGDTLDLGSGKVTLDRVSEAFSFEEKTAYLRQYAADRAVFLAEAKVSCPEPGRELYGLFREHFHELGKLSSYFNSQIDMTVRFEVTGPHGGQWDVSLSRDGVSVAEKLADNPSYTVMVEGRWLVPVLVNKMNWESLFLSLRARFHRAPDVYNDYFIGLLKHADTEALRAVEEFDTARRSEERITVQDGMGTSRVISRFCPHAGEDLSSGAIVQGTTLTCLRHGFAFDLDSGKCLNARCESLDTSRLP